MAEIAELMALDRLLTQICRLHHARAHALLEGLGLYRGQPPLLWTLAAEPGLAHSELAARLHVTPATVSKMVSRMEKLGILETRDDVEDQRISRVFLTPAGQALHAQAGTVGEQLGAEAFESFTAADLAQLEGYLRQIHANLIGVQGEAACGGPDRHSKVGV
jgi:DNA-binding MarR family transcriptional regulator